MARRSLVAVGAILRRCWWSTGVGVGDGADPTGSTWVPFVFSARPPPSLLAPSCAFSGAAARLSPISEVVEDEWPDISTAKIRVAGRPVAVATAAASSFCRRCGCRGRSSSAEASFDEVASVLSAVRDGMGDGRLFSVAV